MFHDHSFRLYSLSQNGETDVSGLAKPTGKGWKSICYVLKDGEGEYIPALHNPVCYSQHLVGKQHACLGWTYWNLQGIRD